MHLPCEAPHPMNTTVKSTLIVCALALLSSSAWSSAVDQAKPRNRLAAKLKPAAAAPAPEVPVEDHSPLSEEQLAVAPHVHAGEANCEFKSKVSVTPHPEQPGRFRLQFGRAVYNMAPEPTTTGAVRLEDKQAGVVWLQIPAKSMLMNTRIGQRLVDGCQHAEQVAMAQVNEPLVEGGIGITPSEPQTPPPAPVAKASGKKRK